MDIVSRYQVDGFHFDYIRYPGLAWGYNAAAVSRFQARFGRTVQPASTDPAWLQFRRDQVSALVRKVYLSAMALKPALKISAATITWTPSIASETEWANSPAYANVSLAPWAGDLFLSNIRISPGTNGWVGLGNNTGQTGKVVVADAVRFVYAANQDPPPGGDVPEWWAVHYFGAFVEGPADADRDGYGNLESRTCFFTLRD